MIVVESGIQLSHKDSKHEGNHADGNAKHEGRVLQQTELLNVIWRQDIEKQWAWDV